MTSRILILVAMLSSTAQANSPWSLNLDVEGGKSWLEVDRPREIDKTGYTGSLRFGVQYSMAKFGLDIGGGYFQTSLQGAKGNIKQSAGSSGLLLDAGPTWHISEHWDLSTKARWQFGSETDLGPVDDSKAANMMLLAGAYYHFKKRDSVRIGIHYQKDLTIAHREFESALLSIGYAWRGKTETPTPAPSTEEKHSQPAKATEVSAAPAPRSWIKVIPANGSNADAILIGSKDETLTLAPGLYRVEITDEGVPAFKPYATQTNIDLEPLVAGLKALLKAYPDLRIKITGHADTSGNPRRNKQLSTERALWLHAELIKAGLHPSRLAYEGQGSKNPRASNETADGRSANRRVEIFIAP